MAMHSRDQILLAFHQACERPSAQDVIEWTEKYPQFAEDIRAHAVILRDWAAQEELPRQVPDDLALARARNRAMNALNKDRSGKMNSPQTDPHLCDRFVFVLIAEDGSSWISEENFDTAIAEIYHLKALLLAHGA